MKIWPLLVAAAALAGAACSKDNAAESRPAPATTPAAAAPAGELKEGDRAPDVNLTLEDGKSVKLSSLRGTPVALYFYPKDDTPGCTVEAQGIRDAWADFEKSGVKVFGVSTQDAASHKDFIAKHKLPFQLVVDPDGEVAKAFGVPLRGGMASRQSFLIDQDGKVKKVWRQVTPSGHAQELLSAAKSLGRPCSLRPGGAPRGAARANAGGDQAGTAGSSTNEARPASQKSKVRWGTTRVAVAEPSPVPGQRS
ncbi:MAG TPA: peroxiredoxin [Polyangiaceae bacterium]|nr:peroxiredoxin [Polyangiaceae bacterium]